MVLYAGETVRVNTTVTDPDGNPIIDTDVNLTSIEILDSDLNVVVDAALAFDPGFGYFFYDWDTPGSGTFTARLRLMGLEFDVWEFQKIKIKTNKDGFTEPIPPVDLGGVGILSTKGDILSHDGANPDRLPVGPDGQGLVADSVETLGVKWTPVITDFDNTHTWTEGQIILEQSATPTPVAEGRVEWGTTNQHLVVGDGATPGQIEFAPFVDEDDMVSDSDLLVPTQQSVKAHVATAVETINIASAGEPSSITEFVWGMPGLSLVNTSTAAAMQAARLSSIPIFVHRLISITGVAIYVTVGVASSTLDVEIFKSSPTALWDTTGSNLLTMTPLDTSSNNQEETDLTINLSLDPGRYLLQFKPTGAISVRLGRFMFPGYPIALDGANTMNAMVRAVKAGGTFGDTHNNVLQSGTYGMLCPVILKFTELQGPQD